MQAQIPCLCLGLAQAPRIWISKADWDLPKPVPNHPEKIGQSLIGWTESFGKD